MTVGLPEVCGFIANISSNFAFLPQIIKSFRRKRVADVSIGMFTILFLTQLCWIGYAIPIHARQLWISSVIEIALLLPIFAMWVMYRERKERKISAKDAAKDAEVSPIVYADS